MSRRTVLSGLLAVAALVCFTPSPSTAAPTTSSYGYDSLGRLTSVAYANSANVTTITYGYDPAGNRLAGDLVVAANQSVATPINTPLSINAIQNGSDVGAYPLTVVAVSTASNGTVAINAPGDQRHLHARRAAIPAWTSFTFTLSDSHYGTSTATATVNVGGSQPPVAHNDSATTAENTASQPIAVLANDTGSYALTVTGATNGAHGTTAVNSATTVTYTPAANYTGSDSFTYSISDGHGGTASAMVAVTVTGGGGPVAANDSATTAENTPSQPIAVLANDTGSYALTVTGATNGAHGTTVVNSGTTVTYTPAANYTGSDSFTYSISDGHGGTASATVAMTVNAPPVANPDNATTVVNTPVTTTVLANDTSPESYGLTVTSATNGAHGTTVVNSGTTVTYTPTSGYTGTDSYTYTISDGHGGTATATVSVTINSAGGPVAVNDSWTISVVGGGSLVTIQGTFDPRTNDSSPSGYALTITGVTQGSLGTITFTGTTVTYTANTQVRAPFTGHDSFTYTISDGHGGTATATVSVTGKATVF